MSWTYVITTGTLVRNGAAVGHGYSGHSEGLNNPSMCNVRDVGPLPQGTYTIGQAHDSEHVGKFALPLAPDSANVMFGRSAFYIHGDNPQLNHTASDGCIILVRPLREAIAGSGDTELLVIA